jgi:hypothetical protein
VISKEKAREGNKRENNGFGRRERRLDHIWLREERHIIKVV